MMKQLSTLVEQYSDWIRDRTSLRKINGDWIEITTPYLDRHNDCIQIYARKQDDGFLLTDGGEILEDLTFSGCSLDSPKRQKLLSTALAGFGIKNEDGRLEVTATTENFPQRKHSLVQSMLAVNDLFFLSDSHVGSLFYEDVTDWLDSHEIRYSPNVSFAGKGGLVHKYDFLIPRSKAYPERLIRAISRPDKNAAITFAFSWMDTRETRPDNSLALAFLNDQEHKVPGEVVETLRSYSIEPIGWSEREKMGGVLVA
jgi:hypothetical protein